MFMAQTDPLIHGYMLLLMAVAWLLLGLLVVLMLLRTWRRHNERFRRLSQSNRRGLGSHNTRPAVTADPWMESGFRMTAPPASDIEGPDADDQSSAGQTPPRS